MSRSDTVAQRIGYATVRELRLTDAEELATVLRDLVRQAESA